MTAIHIELEKLRRHMEKLGPVAVAVSGGVDSMTLAFVANQVHNNSEYFHALSPAVPPQATARVKDYARRESWNLKLVNAREINDPNYLANPANRCYFCKTNLYDTIAGLTKLTLVSGTNTDDLGDYRPGLIAAREHEVSHPYVDVGISKAQLRDIARHLGLNDIQSLPAAPCLSSRVSTGIPIDQDLLPIINAAEQQLWEALQPVIPLNGIRCRIRPEGVAVEIDSPLEADNHAGYAARVTEIIQTLFSQSGFEHQCRQISIEPYKRGSAFLIDTQPIE